MAGTRQIHFVI